MVSSALSVPDHPLVLKREQLPGETRPVGWLLAAFRTCEQEQLLHTTDRDAAAGYGAREIVDLGTRACEPHQIAIEPLSPRSHFA
jgi:hypothetical protein